MCQLQSCSIASFLQRVSNSTSNFLDAFFPIFNLAILQILLNELTPPKSSSDYPLLILTFWSNLGQKIGDMYQKSGALHATNKGD